MQNAAHTLIFDLDGTLVDSVGVVGSILNAMRAEAGRAPLDQDFYRHWSSRGGVALVGRALEVGPDQALSQVDEFRRRYRERPTPDESVFPGAHSTLEQLSQRGVRLAICSNKPEHLCRKVLHETGLGRYFDAIIGGDTTPRGKPDPAPLLAAMAAIGAQPATTLMIGDSTVDQKTAAAAKVGFVFYSAGYDDGVDRDAAVASIAALPALLHLAFIGGAAAHEIAE